MAESGGIGAGFGNTRYPYYYGPEGPSSHIKPTKPLVEPSEKIFTIDGHIGATGSGYIGDILQLIDEIQLAAQKHRLTYESPIDVNTLAKHLSSYLHNYTIYAVRPQAASIIIAGLDQTGVHLFQVDPSGTFFRGAGFAIGQYSDIALDLILSYPEIINTQQ